MGGGGWGVRWRGTVIVACPTFSAAKTIAKRINSMAIWLSKSDGVYVTDFLNSFNNFMFTATAPGNGYVPPLNSL